MYFLALLNAQLYGAHVSFPKCQTLFSGGTEVIQTCHHVFELAAYWNVSADWWQDISVLKE